MSHNYMHVHVHVYSQMTDFGMATVKDGSPSMLLVHDLRKRGLPLNAFITCLERIHCQRALNEFIPASEYTHVQCIYMYM